MRLVTVRALLLVVLLGLARLGHVARADDSATPEAAGVTIQLVLRARFDDAPPAPAFIAVTRYTLPPGTSIASGTTTGPRLFLVENGEVTIQSTNADSGFRRAADAPPISGEGGPDVTLRPGDHYRPTDPTSFALRNDGTLGADFLDVIVCPQAPFGLVPYTTMDGIVVDPLGNGVAGVVPGAPVELRIERLDVASGQRVALAAVPGPRLFVVESGTLGLAADAGVITYSGAAGTNPGSTAGRARTVAPGTQSLLTARGSVFVQAGASGTATNLGRSRLMLLSVSLLPANPATAASLAADSATPAA
ncbi:MAG TPA: hypothetical protein VH482_32335 [Thermomicrobiales bacterium]